MAQVEYIFHCNGSSVQFVVWNKNRTKTYSLEQELDLQLGTKTRIRLAVLNIYRTKTYSLEQELDLDL